MGEHVIPQSRGRAVDTLEETKGPVMDDGGRKRAEVMFALLCNPSFISYGRVQLGINIILRGL